MKNKLRLLCALCASVVILSGTSGCAVIVARQLAGKLPEGKIGQGKVSVSVAGIGGGTIHVKDAVKTADGKLSVGEYHSEVNTATGTVRIDLIDAELSTPLKK